MIKMTNKLALEFVLGLEEVQANTEVMEKLQKMLAQVEKKNSSVGADGTKVLSATQKQNENLKMVILEELGKSESPLQIKELLTKDGLSQYSNQKLSALIRQLVSEGKVERFEDKKVAKFGLVK